MRNRFHGIMKTEGENSIQYSVHNTGYRLRLPAASSLIRYMCLSSSNFDEYKFTGSCKQQH